MNRTSDQKIYIITGASRGVGREICTLLRGRGDKVISLSRRQPEHPVDTGIGQDWVECDLADQECVNAVLKGLSGDAAPSIDGIFLNAATAGFGNIADMAPDQMEEIFRVNLFSHAELLTGLRKKLPPGSKVICISTSASRIPAPKFGIYAASKIALENVVQTMSMEEDWKLSIVRPSEIDTEFAKNSGVPSGFDDGVNKLTPRKVAERAVACLDGGRVFANVGLRARIIDAVVRIRPQWLLGRRQKDVK